MSVYGSYYDEARITYQTMNDATVAELAKRSLQGFAILEKKTGTFV